jgi:predicted nucleic acid-binding protein
LITAKPAVLDTCVLINLLATGRMAEMLQVVAPSCLVCSAVSRESLYLRSADPEEKPEPVNLSTFFESGTLQSCDVEASAEEELYVAYALELDDGEAMSLAIAQSRDFALATDERKARRVISEDASGLVLISTAEIVHAWSANADRSDVVAAARSIEVRARFRPAPADPLLDWWRGLVS